jgi:hypothetical protein
LKRLAIGTSQTDTRRLDMEPKIDKNCADHISREVNKILRMASHKMSEEDFFSIEMAAEGLMQYIYKNSLTEEEEESQDLLDEQTANYYRDLGL